MFGDFDDPFGLPEEELVLATPSVPPSKHRGPAYMDEEARELAAFGECGDIGKDLGYAWRAKRRAHELRLKIAKRRETHATSCRLRDDELIVLAAKLPATVAVDENKGRAAAVQKALTITAERTARVQEQKAQLEREHAPIRQRERETRARLEECDQEFQRADAAFKAIEQSMSASAGDPAARAPFEAQYQARHAELGAARQEKQRTEVELAEASRALAEVLSRVQEVNSSLRQAEEEHQNVRRQHEDLLKESEEQDDARTRTRAMKALESGEAGAILAAPCLDAFERARASGKDLALHIAALTSMDTSAYRRGAEASVALIALAMTAVVAAVLL